MPGGKSTPYSGLRMLELLSKEERKMKKFLIVLVGLMVLADCATTTPIKYEGVFVPKEYLGVFERADEHVMRWIKPGVDFSKYNKAMIDYVIFGLDAHSEYKGINAAEMKKLADAASLALVNAIKEKYEVVAEPGPDVIRIKFAITDLKQSKPAESVVTTVLPVGMAISLVEKGAEGEWTGGGLTKGEVAFLDSMTNKPIAAAYGELGASFGERFTKWGEVQDAFKLWGERIDKAWTSLRAGKSLKGTETK